MSTPISQCKTAAEAYDVKAAEVQALIAELQAKLVGHRAEFDANGKKDWGYAGDLARMASLLKQALGQED